MKKWGVANVGEVFRDIPKADGEFMFLFSFDSDIENIATGLSKTQ